MRPFPSRSSASARWDRDGPLRQDLRGASLSGGLGKSEDKEGGLYVSELSLLVFFFCLIFVCFFPN